MLVHTGQNYDYTLNDVFFEELGLRAPDHYPRSRTPRRWVRYSADMLIATEECCWPRGPTRSSCSGDTNSCIAAIMAKRMQIPVFHMEAGNRCFDENVPEETNRRLVDHVADFNLVYTEHARRNLLAEGLHPRTDPDDWLADAGGARSRPSRDRASDARGALGLEVGEYVLVSAHREENVDKPTRLSALLDCLDVLHRKSGLPVLVSTHPRTRKRLEEGLGRTVRAPVPRTLRVPRLQPAAVDARCVLSDRGTIRRSRRFCASLPSPCATPSSVPRPWTQDLSS